MPLTTDSSIARDAQHASRLRWALPAGLALATLITFSPALRAVFVNWDDDVNVVYNPAIRGLGTANLHWMFTTALGGHYQPLTWLSLALDYRIAGLKPFVYHLTNVLLHVLGVLLFYALALKLLHAAGAERGSGNGVAYGCAGFAAAVFALHPLRVESVAWVTERRDVLSGVLLFAAVLAYLRSVRTARPAVGWYALALALFGASLLSKAAAMTAPLVLLVLDYYPLRRPARQQVTTAQLLLETMPFAVLAAIAGYIAMRAQQSSGSWRSLAEQDFWSRAAVATHGCWFYLYKLVRPTDLSPLYPMPPREMLVSRAVLMEGAVIALLLAIAVRRRRDLPALLAALLSYLILLAPVSGLAQSGKHLVADRYSYLSLLPIALLGAGGLLRMQHRAKDRPDGRRNARVFAVLAGTYVAGVALLAAAQCGVWRDSITLWQHAVKLDPRNHVAFINLGEACRLAAAESTHSDDAAKLLDEALSAMVAALRIDPRDAKAHNGAGILLVQRGKPQEGLAELHAAVALDPTNPEYLCNVGYTLSGFGKLSEAADAYRRAVQAAPQWPPAAERLGAVLIGMGRYAEAREALSEAEARGAVSPALQGTFAWLLATCPQDDIRDGARAQVLAESLCQATAHQDPWALDTLAAAYAEAGAFDRAVVTAERALQLAQERKADPLVTAVTERLALYRAGKPYRDNRPVAASSQTP